MLREEKWGRNGQGHRHQKRARGVGLQGPRGILGSRLRVASKRRAGAGGRGRREWEMYSQIVDPIPEERCRIGYNIAVNLIRMIADMGSEGCRALGGVKEYP